MIAVDQLMLVQPGLVPKTKVKPVLENIWGATVFVDVAMKWIKVFLFHHASIEETIAVKDEIDHVCATQVVEPLHY